MDYSDYDKPDFIHTEIRKSRRERTCGTCKKPIKQGERYNRIVAKFPNEKLEVTEHHTHDCWTYTENDYGVLVR